MPEKKQDQKKGIEWTAPYKGYNFKLQIGDLTEGHFKECSGITAKNTVIAYREAGNNQIVHHLPGPVEYSGVTLTKGLTSSTKLWEWFMAIVAGKDERKNVSIILLNSEGTNEVMRWNLLGAWPSEWHGARFDALGMEIAVESVTLIFDSIERENAVS
ncbi:MAG: phage tail protein [Chitinivibrionales bacterium]|nr:phage tail protein [Chitinivibrionales bacterium]